VSDVGGKARNGVTETALRDFTDKALSGVTDDAPHPVLLDWNPLRGHHPTLSLGNPRQRHR
jgi:hypothetical protein